MIPAAVAQLDVWEPPHVAVGHAAEHVARAAAPSRVSSFLLVYIDERGDIIARRLDGKWVNVSSVWAAQLTPGDALGAVLDALWPDCERSFRRTLVTAGDMVLRFAQKCGALRALAGGK